MIDPYSQKETSKILEEEEYREYLRSIREPKAHELGLTYEEYMENLDKELNVTKP